MRFPWDSVPRYQESEYLTINLEGNGAMPDEGESADEELRDEYHSITVTILVRSTVRQ